MRLNRERLEDFASMLDVLLPSSGRVALATPLGTAPPLTHARLYETIANFSLAAFGVKPKAHVATMVPAGDVSAGILLCLMSRYSVAPLNADYRREELLAAIKMLSVQAVLTTPAIVERLGEMPVGVTLLVVSPRKECAGVFDIRFAGWSGPPPAPAQDTRCPLNGPDDVSLLLQTSGTTSKPKTVPVTLRRLVLGALTYGEAMGLRADDCGLNVMPFYHIGGISTNLLCVLLFGGGVVCSQAMKEDRFLQWLHEHRVTYYSAVPTQHQIVMQLFENDGAHARAGCHLRTIATGAAHLAHPLSVRLRDATGAAVIPTYGMSECMPISVHNHDYRLDRPESVGRRVGDLRLFKEDGSQAPPGTQGEVCVRGPLLMPQYMGGGFATFQGGDWFRTGDVGMLDEDEYLYLVGRSKEVINRGGELISPFEVESVAVTHPLVERCMAFGAPHAALGETCALAVVPEEGCGSDFSLPNLQIFLLEKLSPHKVPELVVLMAEIPKGSTGKVQRIGFAERLGLEALEADAPSSQRMFEATAASPSGPWTLTPIMDANEVDQALPTATDSLGFSRKLQTDEDLQATRLQEALYGLCIAKLMFNHWLPHGSLRTSIPGQTDSFMALLSGMQDSRTCLVLIFPLLGFFDGREVQRGENPLRRLPIVLLIYMAMAWPHMLPSIGEGFATFHRWPLYVWLISMCFTTACQASSVPAWLQVFGAFALAPVFRFTVDNYHEQQGDWDFAGVSLAHPTLLFLEDRFYYSVGMKLYFMGCYLFAYHYLSGEAVFKKLMVTIRCSLQFRAAAFVLLCVLSVFWEHTSTPFELTGPVELADWPSFLGNAYLANILMDWTLMFLVIVAVGEGCYLLRLMGQSILGTMICHMYLQLPLSDMLHEAAYLGGPTLVLVVLFLVPVLYTLSVGRLFQAVLLSPITLYSTFLA